jgi:P27 family predicted phage terminase small subunit
MKKSSPKAPSHLSADARALWARLHADYVLDDAGGLLLLQSACEAYDRLQEARRILAKEGSIATDRWGQRKPHPAAGVERDARNQMHGALRLLRLSPAETEEHSE